MDLAGMHATDRDPHAAAEPASARESEWQAISEMYVPVLREQGHSEEVIAANLRNMRWHARPSVSRC
jgi:hypothetical protein